MRGRCWAALAAEKTDKDACSGNGRGGRSMAIAIRPKITKKTNEISPARGAFPRPDLSLEDAACGDTAVDIKDLFSGDYGIRG